MIIRWKVVLNRDYEAIDELDRYEAGGIDDDEENDDDNDCDDDCDDDNELELELKSKQTIGSNNVPISLLLFFFKLLLELTLRKSFL